MYVVTVTSQSVAKIVKVYLVLPDLDMIQVLAHSRNEPYVDHSHTNANAEADDPI